MDAKSQKHQFTITYGFDAKDDAQAREVAKAIISILNPRALNFDCLGSVLFPDGKLQRIHDDKQPEAMEF